MKEALFTKKKLVYQISSSYLFLFTISIALFTYTIATSQIELISENVRHKAIENAQSLSHTLNTQISNSNEDPQKSILGVMKLNQIPYLIVREQQIIVRDSLFKGTPTDYQKEVSRSLSLVEHTGAPVYFRFQSNNRVLELYIPIVSLEQFVVIGQIELQSIDARFHTLYRSIGLTVGLLTILFFIFGLILHRRLIRPLTLLYKATRQVAQGHFESKINITQDDEFGSLAKSFNYMTQTIADHLNSLQEQMERIEKAKKQIEEMSRMDTLTGLFNRRYLFESLQYQLDLSNRYQSEIGLMILDVDFFKKINDGYGHKMGDEVLRVLGATLKKLCRNVDILGRYGGEELVVFCPKTNLENTRVLAERIRVEVSKLLFKVDSEKTFSISVSIGVSENLFAKKIKNQELNPSDLIDTADGCLYIAKENGRNQVVVFGEQSHE